MSAREPLSDEELDVLSEKLLAKLLGRLAQRAKAENDEEPPAKRPPPSAEAIADVLARRRRRGR